MQVITKVHSVRKKTSNHHPFFSFVVGTKILCLYCIGDLRVDYNNHKNVTFSLRSFFR